MSRGRIFIVACCMVALPFIMGAKPARIVKDAESVELFAAIKAKQVEVKLIPKDATEATVLIENKTAKPLRIALPAAFAGVPVLAQDDFGGGGDDFGGGGFGADQGGQQQQQQAMGGGMGGGGMMGGGGGMMGGGGMFNVAPERTRKVKVRTVCLEHGKKDPHPRVPYELRPIDSFTSDASVHHVCAMLGRGEVDQVSAQAATWHLTDKLTLQQLASKVKVKHLNGTREMYFSPAHLQRASKIVRVARVRAEKTSKKSKSPGEVEPVVESPSADESL